DCGVDSTAAGRNLLIALALEPLFKLRFTRAGKDEMRMAVDQAGEDGLAGGVDDFGVGRARRQFGGFSNPGDSTIVDSKRPVFNYRQFAHAMPTLHDFLGARDAYELGGVADN